MSMVNMYVNVYVILIKKQCDTNVVNISNYLIYFPNYFYAIFYLR